MADKWDEMTTRVQQGFLAEEPEAVMAATFGLLAEFGRTFEQIGADLDRLATAAESQNQIVNTLADPFADEPVEPKPLDL